MIEYADRLGGSLGGAIIAKAFRSKLPEVRELAAKTTARTFYGEQVLKELIRLLKDKSDPVREAAFRGLGALSNWRVPVAQAYLCAYALKRGNPLEWRIMAIRMFDPTLHTMFMGNFEDSEILLTLVKLMQDSKLEVREAAFARLKDRVADTFGYAPDLDASKRKATFKRWVKWYQSTTGPFKVGTQPGSRSSRGSGSRSR